MRWEVVLVTSGSSRELYCWRLLYYFELLGFCRERVVGAREIGTQSQCPIALELSLVNVVFLRASW